MTAIAWLEDNAPGFRELPPEERNAIMEFVLLWSLFEAKALNTQCNADSIHTIARTWGDHGLLNPEMFEPALSYFLNRYFDGENFTDHYEHLHIRRSDLPELVRSVLRRDVTDIADVVTVLLIIVYRFRNNLLHGLKWAYGIHGQLENFTHAKTVMIQAIEIHERSQYI